MASGATSVVDDEVGGGVVVAGVGGGGGVVGVGVGLGQRCLAIATCGAVIARVNTTTSAASRITIRVSFRMILPL